MNGDRLVVDSNIAIYLFKGNPTIIEILQNKIIYLSIITEIELFAFKKISESEELRIKKFISDCFVIGINEEIKQRAIAIRKETSLKLPDCIIAATALYLQATLFTADKIFNNIPELDLMFYSDLKD